MNLEEIEARAAKASEGPWLINKANGTFRMIDDVDAKADFIFIHSKTPDDEPYICENPYLEDDDVANMTFIAHARQDIPELCAALREAIEALEWIRDSGEICNYSGDVIDEALMKIRGEK